MSYIRLLKGGRGGRGQEGCAIGGRTCRLAVIPQSSPTLRWSCVKAYMAKGGPAKLWSCRRMALRD